MLGDAVGTPTASCRRSANAPTRPASAATAEHRSSSFREQPRELRVPSAACDPQEEEEWLCSPRSMVSHVSCLHARCCVFTLCDAAAARAVTRRVRAVQLEGRRGHAGGGVASHLGRSKAAARCTRLRRSKRSGRALRPVPTQPPDVRPSTHAGVASTLMGDWCTAPRSMLSHSLTMTTSCMQHTGCCIASSSRRGAVGISLLRRQLAAAEPCVASS